MDRAIRTQRTRRADASRSSWLPCQSWERVPPTSSGRARYLVDRADWEAIGRVHGEVFGEIRPASTMIVVAGLLDPRWRVEIEAEAILDTVGEARDHAADGTAP